MDLDFKDMATVITGVSQCIDQAPAEGLTQQGIQSELCTRDKAYLKGIDQQIARKYGGKVIVIRRTMVASTTTSSSFTSSIEKTFNGANILISNTLASEFIKYNIHPNTILTLNYIKMACGRSKDIDITGNTLTRLR
jgi:NADP-dependent 3-hydroxy acid dehydrogenase YdfG